MQLGDSVTILPYLHGKTVFAQEVRKQCLEHHFDCIVVDLPECFQDDLPDAVGALPIIHALVARQATGPFYYLPIDPCDASIEAIRQSFQMHAPFIAAGFPTCEQGEPLPPLPDEYAARSLGFDAYTTLCLTNLQERDDDHGPRAGRIAPDAECGQQDGHGNEKRLHGAPGESCLGQVSDQQRVEEQVVGQALGGRPKTLTGEANALHQVADRDHPDDRTQCGGHFH